MPKGKSFTLSEVSKLVKAPMEPKSPARFEFDSLLSPSVFPINDIPPFFSDEYLFIKPFYLQYNFYFNKQLY